MLRYVQQRIKCATEYDSLESPPNRVWHFDTY